MSYQEFLSFERRGAVGIVRLARPEKLNTISAPFYEAMIELQQTEIVGDHDLRAIALLADGRHFSAGIDLNYAKAVIGKPGRSLYGVYHWQQAYLDEDGYLYLRGRKDSLIISGGENIYPEEVIDVLLKMPEIAEAAVYGMPDPKWGEHVKASIVCKPGRSLTVEQVQTFCRANMPSFRMPREVEFLPELPKNATGKVLIQALKNR